MKGISRTSRVLLCAALAMASCPAFCEEEFVEWVGANSGVNWSNGQIQAEGAGVAPEGQPPSRAKLFACRAAVVDAQRNLLESIKGVRVEGTTVVANMMVESDTIRTSVNGVLQGGKVVSREADAEGGCVVTMTAPLGGKFAQAVYGEVFEPKSAFSVPSLESMMARATNGILGIVIPTAHAAELPSPTWQDAIDQLNARISGLEDLLAAHPAIVEKADSGPTGLVLDARGTNFVPSMSPKIRKLRAGIIYPTSGHQVSRRDRGQLVSLFTRSPDTARRHPAVGDRPLVLKALRTFGETRTEIVLGTETATRLDGLISNGFLNDSGVIIVL